MATELTTPAPLDPVERRPTSTVIAEAIRTRITDGSFPPGYQLTEAELAAQLHVSRGPVREALQRLIQEGLLHSEPHRGVFVITLESADVIDVYLARATIEREAARLLVERGDREPLRRLEAIVRDMAVAARSGVWGDITEADLRFHETLVGTAGSPRLARMYATLLAETRLSFVGLHRSYPNPRVVVSEHRALLRALRAGDAAEVAARVDEHLGRAARQPIREAPVEAVAP